MGGPNTRITNPRWRRPPSWQIVNWHIFATVWAISTKIWPSDAVRPLLTVRTVANVKFKSEIDDNDITGPFLNTDALFSRFYFRFETSPQMSDELPSLWLLCGFVLILRRFRQVFMGLPWRLEIIRPAVDRNQREQRRLDNNLSTFLTNNLTLPIT